jgi:hypothetical protein
MPIPILVQLGGWAQALPLIPFLNAQRRSRAGSLIVTGGLVSLLGDLAGRIMATHLGNNQLMSYLSSPITAGCYLAAVAEWQVDPRSRSVFRWSVLGFAVVWIALTLGIEDVQGLGRVTTPMYALVLIVAALWTLLRRSQVVLETSLLRTDWFWCATGLAVQGAAMAFANAVGAIFLERQRIDLFALVWNTRAAFLIISYALLAWGIYLGPAVPSFAAEE